MCEQQYGALGLSCKGRSPAGKEHQCPPEKKKKEGCLDGVCIRITQKRYHEQEDCWILGLSCKGGNRVISSLGQKEYEFLFQKL